MPGSRFPHLPLPPPPLSFSSSQFLRLEQILAAPASPAMGASCQNEKANAEASSLAASPSSWFLAPGHPNKISVDLGWERADPHRNLPPGASKGDVVRMEIGGSSDSGGSFHCCLGALSILKHPLKGLWRLLLVLL